MQLESRVKQAGIIEGSLMGLRISSKGKGLQDMLDALDRAITETPAELKRNLDRAVDRTTEAMRDVAPVRTGRLAASGAWSSTAVDGLYIADIEYGAGLDYARYALHSGTNGVRMSTAFAMGELAVDDAINAAWPF